MVTTCFFHTQWCTVALKHHFTSQLGVVIAYRGQSSYVFLLSKSSMDFGTIIHSLCLKIWPLLPYTSNICNICNFQLPGQYSVLWAQFTFSKAEKVNLLHPCREYITNPEKSVQQCLWCIWGTELWVGLCTTQHVCIMDNVVTEETHQHFSQKQRKSEHTQTEIAVKTFLRLRMWFHILMLLVWKKLYLCQWLWI